MPSPIKRESKNIIFIVVGILSAAMGLHGFLLSSNFIDGGVTGVSMLLEKITGWPLAILLPIVNLPFIVVGYRSIGRAFAIRSCLAITGLALVLALVTFPDVTPDKVLTAFFGGFFIGAGVGLTIRGGAVLDGTEIAALMISKYSSSWKVGDVILVFNIILFICAMSALGVEPALYSIVTYFAAAKTLDFVIHGIDEFTALTIISDQPEAIKSRITRELGRGVTVYVARGGNSDTPKDVLYSVVTRLEVGKVKSIIEEIDATAFWVVHPLSDVHGGVIKRSLAH